MRKTKLICPRCKNTILSYPAISRRDNKTFICSECGVLEAMEDYIGKSIYEILLTTPKYWKDEDEK